MGESHDFITLDWVQTDIEETLRHAQEHLETYLSNVGDSTPLNDCYEAVHQVHGSLQMVGVSGAMLLTEHMQLLLIALREDKVQEKNDAHAALVQALVVLQPYLDRLKKSADETPILLLPTINEIQRVLGINLLSEFVLFEPVIPKPLPASEEVKAKFDDQAIVNVKKLRQIYQFALTGLIRKEAIKINSARMSNVLARFQQLCKNSPVNQLFEIAAAFMEGLLNETIELDYNTLNALRDTDKEVKNLISTGVAGLDNPPDPETLKTMLYAIAKSTASTPHIELIKQEYALRDYQLSSPESPDTSLVAGPDKDTLNSVVVALREELERIKDTIDLYVRNEDKSNIDLGGLQPGLQQISNTLLVLNLEAPRLVAQEQLDTLKGYSSDNVEIPENVLLEIAESLLYVEAELETVLESVNSTKAEKDHGSVTETVLSECLENLKQSKEAMSEYFSSDHDMSQLENVPTTLHGVYGGLTMLSIANAGQLILAVSKYIEDDILAMQKDPEPATVEVLAEVISTVEYYLDGIVSGKSVGESVLEPAKRHVASLGYPVEQAQGIISEQDDDPDGTDLSADSLNFELADDLDLDSWDTPEETDTKAEIERPRDEPEEPVVSLKRECSAEETAKIINFEIPEETDKPDRDETEMAVKSDDKPEQAEQENSLVDDEILEIFVEEAEEVFESIDVRWPAFLQDSSDQDALTDVRRAFHTLKGSGRMVGASVLGDLSWSVENMLNQLIEGAISFKPAMVTMVDDVRDVLPSLLVQFSHNTDAEIDVASLIQRAEHLAGGGDATEQVDAADVDAVDECKEVASEEITIEEVASEEITIEEAASEEIIIEDAANEEINLEETTEEIILEETTSEQEVTFEEVASEAVDNEEIEKPDLDLDFGAPVAANDEPLEDEDYVEDSCDEIEQIFIKEASEHLATMDEFVGQVKDSVEPALLSAPLYRALHTLSGGAQMAQLDAVAEIAAAGERHINELRAYEIPADQELLDIISEASKLMKAGLAQLESGSELEIEGAQDFLQRAQQVSYERLSAVRDVPGQAVVGQVEYAAMKTSPFQSFLINNIDRICDVNEQYEIWSSQGANNASLLTQLCAEIDELRSAAGDMEIPVLTELLTAIKGAYLFLQEHPDQGITCLDALADGHENLVSIMDECAAGLDVTINTEVIAALNNITKQVPEEAVVEQAATEAKADNAEPGNVIMPEPVQAQAVDTEADAELLAIFLEEAEEIAEVTANAKQRWMENNTDIAAVDELQRGLHTLKGSSRMAGISAIGDLSHELESVYENINAGKVSASPFLFDLLHACDDCLADMVSDLKQGLSLVRPDDLIAQVQKFLAEQLGQPVPAPDSAQAEIKVFDTALGSTIEADVDMLESFLASAKAAQASLSKAVYQSAQSNSDKTALYAQIQSDVTGLKDSAYQAGVHELGDLLQFFVEVIANIDAEELDSEEVQADLSDWLERIQTSYQEIRESVKDNTTDRAAGVEVDLTPDTLTATRDAAQNNIRVPSTLLEQLVNLAGETSVSRARIEQQVSNFGYALEEVGSTVVRLREQLRRLELETEAQILFRAERDGPAHEGFDPLEMDRYSRIQELSRALVETVSDMFDLKDTLRDRLRYTDNLLLQQSRVNTELQIGLMKTRMVPFSRMVPRLQRIVRLVSRELGKSIEFKIKNADAEMDRSLLENMIAPLEHMLRNAVDHGIESSNTRKKAGKTTKGNIWLSLSRDGGDIVLELKDDGAGIDINTIRAKAIERGLMAENAELSDNEILQFILQAGFSTASKVTQISGRGVGMDVVQSEIKKMGGNIKIDSQLGQGTHFTVRLPFTVSVNRALLVTIGDENFALPLSTIEGVVRVSPYELEEYYKEDGPDFEYAGETYDLHYLGDYVGHKQEFTLQNQALPLPVILIRSDDKTAAVQVDSITGSREVVVKPLGVQLSSLPGMSGATILGDGQVVLILDLAAMIRAQSVVHVQPDEPTIETREEESDEVRVMVVDDSVTVRKVATRLLERNGMQVTVAKDGVEAMTKLQDFVPSIILLDIEMPRMDGFELASLVRHDERLSKVPIVMISSRTGQKHQERALEIGVNSFMGKPFQEEGLLDAITEFTAFERAKAE